MLLKSTLQNIIQELQISSGAIFQAAANHADSCKYLILIFLFFNSSIIFILIQTTSQLIYIMFHKNSLFCSG